MKRLIISNLFLVFFFYALQVLSNKTGDNFKPLTSDAGTLGSDHKQLNNVKGAFTFTLSTSAITSAGVYKSDGTLIRTLWSGISYSAGSHTEYWNGFTDAGTPAFNDTYSIKVLSGNIHTTWEGVIGNTSDSITGINHYNAQDVIWGMAITGNYAYCGTNYNEQQASSQKFNINAPQSKVDVLSKGAEVKCIATDGNYVYWGGDDPNVISKSFVFVTKVSDDLEASLSNAVSYKTVYGRTYSSTIDTVTSGSFISGLAVQKAGRYLFVARKLLNRLDVVNKTTGAIVQKLSYIAPTGLATDRIGNLWMTTGTTVSKYTVNSDGSLSSPSIAISGFALPLAVGVSPDNRTVVITDGGSSQQLKAYNNSTGISLWTYGQAGGYTANGATVTNNKFMFWEYYNSAVTQILSYIAFAPDGSFWLGDTGNCRNLHFSSDRIFIEQIMFHGYSYSVRVDKNNPERVFNNYLEFSVNYKKPFKSSWKLVKNWGGNIPANYDDKYNRLRSIATLSNGRTYAVQPKGRNAWEVVELTAADTLRFTGSAFNVNTNINGVNYASQMYPDGSIRMQSKGIVNDSEYFGVKTLSRFKSNNPEWNDMTFLGSASATKNDPYYNGNNQTLKAGEITSSGVIVSFGADKSNTGYHLGGIQSGSNNWLWKTAPSTTVKYKGDYPADGAFDIGNEVHNAGSVALSFGNLIAWGYYGEFWKGSEVNKWTIVNDQGLMVGTFGVTGVDATVKYTPFKGMSGNAFSGNIVYDPNDSSSAYLYHNDESVHGGIHRWKISGLNTIKVQNAKYPSFKASNIAAGANLMSGLAYDSILSNGAGWTRSPENEITISKSNNYWTVQTNILNYSKSSPDVYTRVVQGSGIYSVSKYLGINKVNASWTLSCDAAFPETTLNTPAADINSIDVLDVNEKVIARFQTKVTSYPAVAAYGNTGVIFTGTNAIVLNMQKHYIPLNITSNSKAVTFTYGNYPPVTSSVFDAAAKWDQPKTVRIYFTRSGKNYTSTADIQDMRFLSK